LEHVPLASPADAELASIFAALPRLSLEESHAVVMCEVFAGLDARAALPGVAAAVRDWRPDLIMRETAEFSSYVVAETEGIPHVQVAMGITAIEEFAYALIDDALAALGSRSGTPDYALHRCSAWFPSAWRTQRAGPIAQCTVFEIAWSTLEPISGIGGPAPTHPWCT
jgi:hypothetical protein